MNAQVSISDRKEKEYDNYTFNDFLSLLNCMIRQFLLLSNCKNIEMESINFNEISFNKDFKWLNRPASYKLDGDVLTVTTDNKTDFWQETWYNFRVNTGHIFGAEIKGDFSLEICVEADFTTLYDQAGLMIYVDEKHWLKAGIEYNDGQPMIGSVLTRDVSDWSTGVFTQDPRKFWLRMTKVKNVLCVKYSADNIKWRLLRLCPFEYDKYLVGPMCCSPQREGLIVRFSDAKFSTPSEDILHSN